MPFEDEGGFGGSLSPLSSPRSPQEVESRRRKQAIFRRHMALRQGKTAPGQCEEGKEEVSEGKIDVVAPPVTGSSATGKPETPTSARKQQKPLAPYERALAARQHAKAQQSLSSPKESPSNLQASESTTPRATRGSRRKIELVRKLAEKKFFSRSEPSTPERPNKSEVLSAELNEAEERRSASAPRQRMEDAVREWDQSHDNDAESYNELSVSMETNDQTIDISFPNADLEDSFLNVTGDSEVISSIAEDMVHVASRSDQLADVAVNMSLEPGPVVEAERNGMDDSDVIYDSDVMDDSESPSVVEAERNVIYDSELPSVVEAERTTNVRIDSATLIESVRTEASDVKSTNLVDSQSLNDSHVASSVGATIVDVSGSDHASLVKGDEIDDSSSRPRVDVSRLRISTDLESGKRASLPRIEEVRSPLSKSGCYDMRSVTDDFDDPSWDVSKIAFDVGTNGRRKKEDYDIFDTASWAEASSVSFGTPRGGQLSPYTYGSRFEEEKKESNSTSNDTPESMKSQASHLNVGTMLDEVERFREREEFSFTQNKKAAESPTWDAAKQMFPTVVGKKGNGKDAINMFDIMSWAPSSVGPPNWSETRVELHPDIEEEVSRLMNEGTVAADEDAERDQDAPALNADKDDVPLLDGEETRSDVADELQSLAMRLLGNLGNPANRLDKKERVQAYIAQDDKDLSSVEEVADDNESDDSDTFDGVYMEQGEDDDNLDEFVASIEQEAPLLGDPEGLHVERYPTFDPSTAAAIDLSYVSEISTDKSGSAKKKSDRYKPSPENRPVGSSKRYGDLAPPSPERDLAPPSPERDLAPPSPERTPSPSDDETTEQELRGEVFADIIPPPPGEVFADIIPPPPPPPPPESKRNRSGKKKKKTRASSDVHDIPKIAPPPEEKLRKWEESKRRPFTMVGLTDNTGGLIEQGRVHIKTDRESENQNSEVQQEFSPVHAARARALESALKRVGNRIGKAVSELNATDVVVKKSEETFPVSRQTYEVPVDSSSQRNVFIPEAFPRQLQATEAVSRQLHELEAVSRQLHETEAVSRQLHETEAVSRQLRETEAVSRQLQAQVTATVQTSTPQVVPRQSLAEAVPRPSYSPEAAPRESSVPEDVPGQASSPEAPPRQASSPEAPPRQASSRPRQASPPKAVPLQSSSPEAVPGQSVSVEAIPRPVNSLEAVPSQLYSLEAVPGQSISPVAIPRQSNSPVAIPTLSDSPGTVQRQSSSPEPVQGQLNSPDAFQRISTLDETSTFVLSPDDNATSEVGEPWAVPVAGAAFPMLVRDTATVRDSRIQSNVVERHGDGDIVGGDAAGKSLRKDAQNEPTFSVLLARKGKSKPPSKTTDKVSPQVSVHDLVAGTKMAEKLAIASSAAAQKFEEQYISLPKVDLKHLMASESKQHSQEKIVKSQPELASALSLFCVPQVLHEEELNVTMDSVGMLDASAIDLDLTDGKSHDAVVELSGGAFSPWRKPKRVKTPPPVHLEDAPLSKNGLTATTAEVLIPKNAQSWLFLEVLKLEVDDFSSLADDGVRKVLSDNDNFNSLCQFVADSVNERHNSGGHLSPPVGLENPGADRVRQQQKLQPFRFPPRSESNTMLDAPSVLAANFVSFLYRVAKATGTQSPFGDENPFLREIIGSSMRRSNETQGADTSMDRKAASMQDILFDHAKGHPELIIDFAFYACNPTSPRNDATYHQVKSSYGRGKSIEAKPELQSISELNQARVVRNLNLIVPSQRPSPFETTVWNNPGCLLTVLGFLGDPVAVCRLKIVNRFCNRIIKENEHVVMRDAVRLGGLSMHLRPSFWMWITLEKCGQRDQPPGSAQLSLGTMDAACFDYYESPHLAQISGDASVKELEKMGRAGKWHSVIDRDVSRAFGNMPPHKTGARLRTDSIVRALVTWGRNRIMKRGVRGSGEGPIVATTDKARKSRTGEDGSDASEASQTPTDTVSDWGGVSPVGSFTSSISGVNDGENDRKTPGADKMQNHAEGMRGQHQSLSTRSRQSFVADEDLALGGNTLTEDMKSELQDKLGYILYALAAAHQDVGYCQGMDYVVAHLLRILQDTVLWKAARGTLPSVISSAASIQFQDSIPKNLGESHVVEETVFKVMDTFFTTYNLRHMYWPELRCLKTCCRVFERLIQIKLPVLADHFDHHDLNVGLFALGWFQTLFLYLPSMPSATVCHMWDIWLVERSFKIFFRVGTAILFLSQPILLNHDLEGMMTYLNTFPDATLLNPDILIACALQIKVTNKMLMDIEMEITGGN